MTCITQASTDLDWDAELVLVNGLGRTIRSENPEARFMDLSLEANCSEKHAIVHIDQVFQALLVSAKGFKDSEFVEQDGQLCIDRVMEATSVNQKVHCETMNQQAVAKPLGEDPERALELTIKTLGLLATLRFGDDALRDRLLGPTEVEIEVQAAGLTSRIF